MQQSGGATIPGGCAAAHSLPRLRPDARRRHHNRYGSSALPSETLGPPITAQHEASNHHDGEQNPTEQRNCPFFSVLKKGHLSRPRTDTAPPLVDEDSPCPPPSGLTHPRYGRKATFLVWPEASSKAVRRATALSQGRASTASSSDSPFRVEVGASETAGRARSMVTVSPSL